jgi:alpha-tubulin suppressor-like RCC1 family protein
MALGIICVPQMSLAQSWRDAEDRAKQLVVMIKAGVSVGAGIICGLDESGIYIATADHLVRPGPDPVKITTNFLNHSDREVTAELLDKRDSELDVAVIRVPRNMQFWGDLQDLPFHYKADPSLLKRGSQVYMLGNPGGRSWRINIRPELLAQVRGDLLEFESNLITGGHSGGALLTSERRIAGMLRSDKPPYGEAVNIDRILERFERWGYPVNLRPPLPRVSAGRMRSCHLGPSGEARCWGLHVDFFGFSDSTISPVSGFRFSDISVGVGHTCGVDMDGKALCQGQNEAGQLGVGTKADWQESLLPVSAEVRFQSISAGAIHTCALDGEGYAYCWGAGSEGMLGNASGQLSLVPVAVAGNLRFKSISAGWNHSCGLTDSGDIYCWGGILGSGRDRAGMDPPDAFVPLRIATEIKFRSVSAGNGLGCALAANGDGYCWGANRGANTRGWPERTTLEIARVPGRLKFRTVVAGLGGHACGIATHGRLYCWGDNGRGQLGDGTNDSGLIPVPVASDLQFDSVSPGDGHTCAVASGGATYCWGWNLGNAISLGMEKEKQSESRKTPMRLAVLGGDPGRHVRVTAQPVHSSTTSGGPASATAIVERYLRSVGGSKAARRLPPREWKATLAFPLSGIPDYCGTADVAFREEAGDVYTIQLACQMHRDEQLSIVLKSAGGARTVTGQVSGRRKYNLPQKTLDELWGPGLDSVVSLLLEALSYPRLIAGKAGLRPSGTAIPSSEETAVEFTRGSGRIDALHFDNKSGLLVYLSAVPGKGQHKHLEVYFDRYRDVNGMKIPFQISLNTKERQVVFKIQEVQLR